MSYPRWVPNVSSKALIQFFTEDRSIVSILIVHCDPNQKSLVISHLKNKCSADSISFMHTGQRSSNVWILCLRTDLVGRASFMIFYKKMMNFIGSPSPHIFLHILWSAGLARFNFSFKTSSRLLSLKSYCHVNFSKHICLLPPLLRSFY